MAGLPDELANLPAPQLIEELDFEVRLAQFVAKLVELMHEVGIEYDVELLESDPAKILLEVSAFFDTNLRQRINEAFRANLLPYAYGPNLDILAQFYDVVRLEGEDDEAFRRRIVYNIRGRSPGGTEPRYQAIAMGADVRVADAKIYTIGKSPIVYVAVFSKENGGVPDGPMLAAVDAALQAKAVRMVNDTIVVLPAARTVTNLVFDVWLLPETSNTILTAMETSLRTAWARDGGLGRDLTPSYLAGKLMLDGVQDLVQISPVGTVVVNPYEAVAIGTITLNNRGRAY